MNPRFQPPASGLPRLWNTLRTNAFRGARRWKRRVVEPVPVRAFLLALATLLTGGWAGDGLKGDDLFVAWLPAGTPQGWVRRGVTVAFVLCAWRLFLHRRDLMGVSALSRHPAEPHRALVLPLSVPWSRSESGPGPEFRVGPVRLTADVGEGVELLTGSDPVWLYLRLAHALHGTARTLAYRAPEAGEVRIFDHTSR